MKQASERVYLAGPMTGIEALNYPAFHAAAAQLRALGFCVISPAELNAEADKHAPEIGTQDYLAHWRRCMRVDIAHLVTCDTIAMLPGWQRSRGASWEHEIAERLGMRVMLLHYHQLERA